MRTALPLLALLLVACGVPCPTPLVQRCASPTKVETCGTDNYQSETRDCNRVLPVERRWTCCRRTGQPQSDLSCLPEVDCDPSYARRPSATP